MRYKESNNHLATEFNRMLLLAPLFSYANTIIKSIYNHCCKIYASLEHIGHIL